MSRQTDIADAAIATLAHGGMRGLTHRAVDRAAGLPEGSACYYFRTRRALLQATVERLAELDIAEVPALPQHDLGRSPRRPPNCCSGGSLPGASASWPGTSWRWRPPAARSSARSWRPSAPGSGP